MVMGLLTNPNSSSAGMITNILQKYGAHLSWLTFVVGVASVLIFPHVEFSHKTYFSENALLPGLVRGEFDQENSIHE